MFASTLPNRDTIYETQEEPNILRIPIQICRGPISLFVEQL
jgi:hypothetical protein